MTEHQPEIPFVESVWDSIPGTHRFSHEAMATTFEVVIPGADADYARQAAWAAFDELDRLEAELSRFLENSDVARINNLTANEPLRIGLAAFECLRLCGRIYAETNGAFDITVGSLMECWLNEDKTLRSPSEEQLDLARRRTGTHLLRLDETDHTVRLLTDAVQVDLGGVGKGYAVDRMAELLRDWSIDTALVSAGGSSVLGLGAPAGAEGWPLALSTPDGRREALVCLYLKDRALSGSGLRKGWHIVDPRTARPAQGKAAAWAGATMAATADALSTAFMIMSPDEVKQYCRSHSDVLAMIAIPSPPKDGQKQAVLRFGPWSEFLI